ncbi:MAG: hypothetical protein ACI4EQ_00885 [Lachnospiraceae bacterium]
MNNESNTLSVKENRNYKDTLFRMIFREPKELLSLYNALNGTAYDDPSKLEIVTLENAIYMTMKNDLACVVDCHLNLYEHQSSVNPNMPLRDLLYVAREYEKVITDTTFYSAKQLKIPAPNFVVFYNGTAYQPERVEMKLSDAFQVPVKNPALELKVIQLNINVGFNKELMKNCQTLQEYALYVERVRKYAKQKPLSEAVNIAVQECIKEGILSNFLRHYRAEAVMISIFEYDEEREMELIKQSIRELEREEGREEGRQEGLQEGLQEGRQEGRQEGILAVLSLCSEFGLSKEDSLKQLMDKFHLSKEQAVQYLND